MKIRVLGILVSDRVKEAKELQNVLTKYGCIIKTRIGLHTVEDSCARDGLIILELIDKEEEWKSLEKEVLEIKGVEIQNMNFEI